MFYVYVCVCVYICVDNYILLIVFYYNTILYAFFK